MITKAKTLLYSTSNGETFHTIEGAKKVELANLCNSDSSTLAETAFDVLIAKPREAIAILRFGLPRKPRTTKPPMGRKPRRNLKREMPEIPGV